MSKRMGFTTAAYVRDPAGPHAPSMFGQFVAVAFAAITVVAWIVFVIEHLG